MKGEIPLFLLAHANPVLTLPIILVEMPPVRRERQESTKRDIKDVRRVFTATSRVHSSAQKQE